MRFLFAALVCSCAWSCAAFQQQPAAAATPRMSDPEILDIFAGISKHAARIEPMLQQIHPAEWVAKGAPETYVTQWQSALEQLQAIRNDMSALTQHPDRMQDCMKALFRVQASQKALLSLMGGLRRYQNPALAELIESVSAEDQGDLDRLQQYLLELAGEKEQQYALVDREAQRCRSTLAGQPATPKTNRRTQ